MNKTYELYFKTVKNYLDFNSIRITVGIKVNLLSMSSVGAVKQHTFDFLKVLYLMGIF
jgi:hypothetical protein